MAEDCAEGTYFRQEMVFSDCTLKVNSKKMLWFGFFFPL